MNLEADETRVTVVSCESVEQLDPSLAISAARTAASAQLEPGTRTGRIVLPWSGGSMRILAAVVPSLGVLGYKQFHEVSSGAVRYAIHLFSVDDGRPLGIIDAALVTPLRTAAAAAVAAESYFGDDPPEVTVGVVGSGMEAQAGLRALATVLPVSAARVTSRNEANRRAFARLMGAELGIGVEAVDSGRAAAAGVDVVYVATNSKGAIVIDAEALSGVALVLSIGSTVPEQRELDADVLVGADQVIIDTRQVARESGDVLDAIDSGFDPDTAIVLGDFLARRSVQRPSRTVYKSIGSPEQDIVLAHAILEDAHARGVGTTMASLTAIKWLMP